MQTYETIERGSVVEARMIRRQAMAQSQGDHIIELQCPRCGSHVVHEFRQGVNRYVIDHGAERFDRRMQVPEETIYHRCVDCGYASDTEIWEHEGCSEFTRRRGGACS